LRGDGSGVSRLELQGCGITSPNPVFLWYSAISVCRGTVSCEGREGRRVCKRCRREEQQVRGCRSTYGVPLPPSVYFHTHSLVLPKLNVAAELLFRRLPRLASVEMVDIASCPFLHHAGLGITTAGSRNATLLAKSLVTFFRL
jgi:hypothetical protein